MEQKFSYLWFINRFKEAKDTAEKFILSVDETLFLQPPSEDRWSIAECYSHLIKYGNLYFDNLSAGIANTETTTHQPEQSFNPRWIVKKLISFFEPPYKIKVKTLKPMKPDSAAGYNRMELLDEYVNLQDRFIEQLEKAQHRRVDLSAVKIRHPLVSFIRITLTECFALAEVHQRRHQWQAEQTLNALNEQKSKIV